LAGNSSKSKFVEEIFENGIFLDEEPEYTSKSRAEKNFN